MIKIYLYNNGFEIDGHSDPKICGEVSILAWSYAQTIYRMDQTSEYYTSANDEDVEKRNDGYTYMMFEIKNTFAKWIYEEFKINLKEWAEELWKKEVEIEEVEENLVK